MTGGAPRAAEATGGWSRAQREFSRLVGDVAALPPVHDAAVALASAADAREARDRSIELSRIVVRVAACFALSARAREAVPLDREDADAVRQLLRRGLTDGQWVGLLRRLAPHPRVREQWPGLARAFASRPFVAALDGLLALRRRESVAHGGAGTLADVEEIVERRAPELALVVSTLTRSLEGAQPSRDDVAISAEAGRWFMLDQGARGDAVSLLALPGRDAVTSSARAAGLVALLSEDDDEPCPYLGLRQFEPEHAGVFFGRDAEARALARRIDASPFVTITGPSGSGKSSLVLAGVAPLTGRRLVALRPGGAPVAALAHALADALDEPEAHAELARQLARVPRAAARAVVTRARERGERLLLVVDQGEELVTLAAQTSRPAFAGALASLASLPGDDVRVVLVVREDFFARVASQGALLAVATRAVEVVVDPGRDALVEMLTRPAALLGYVFDPPEFALRVADELRGSRAPLPLLSFVGERLFDVRDRRQKRITEATFAARGGVAGALTAHAEHALGGLSAGERALAKELLTRLVTPDGTRALVGADELLAGAAGDPRAPRVLARLAAARLVVSSEGPRDEPTYELVHEILISEWPALRDAVARQGARAALRDELSRAAAAWERASRSHDLLLRGEALARLADVGEVHGGALELLAASAGAEARARRARRALVCGGVSALLVTMGVLAVMVARAERATRAAELAERRASAALRRATRAGHVDKADARLAEGRPGEALAFLRAAYEHAARDRDDPAVTALSARILRLTLEGAAARVLPDVDGVTSLSLRRGVAVLARGARVTRWDLASGVVAETEQPEQVAAARLERDGSVARLHVSGRLAGEPRGPRGAPARAWFGEGARLLAFSRSASVVAGRAPHATVEVAVRTTPRAGCVGAAHAAFAVGGALTRVAGGVATAALELELDVIDVACADDGSTLVAGADRVTRLHDGARIVSSVTSDAAIARVALSADGARLAVATVDGVVTVRDRAGAVVARLSGPRAPVALAVDAADVVVAGAGEARALRVGLGPTEVDAHRDAVLGIAPLPSGAVVTWSRDKTLATVAASGAVTALSSHGAAVTTATVGAAWAVSGARDREAKVVELASGARVATLDRHDGYVSATALSEATGRFATGAVDRRVRIASLRGGGAAVSPPLSGAPFAMVFSRDGERLGALLDDGAAVVLSRDAATDAVLPAPTGVAEAHAVSSSAGLLLFGGDDGRAWLLDVAGARALPVPPPVGAAVSAASLSPGGRKIALGDVDGVVHVAEVGARAWALVTPHGAPVAALALSPGDDKLGSAGDDGVIRLVELASGRLLGAWRATGRVRALAFSADGARLHAAAGSSLVTVSAAPDLDVSSAFVRSGRASNQRVCDDGARVVAVLPYPPDDAATARCAPR